MSCVLSIRCSSYGETICSFDVDGMDAFALGVGVPGLGSLADRFLWESNLIVVDFEGRRYSSSLASLLCQRSMSGVRLSAATCHAYT